MRFVAAADELGSYEVKANYRTLGPAVRQRHAAGGARRSRRSTRRTSRRRCWPAPKAAVAGRSG